MNTSPATLKPTPSSRHRFHLLDGMRGLAAIAVVYWHAPAYLAPHANHSNYLAVDFFFCLSGFVVAFAYERRLQESLSYWRFLAARMIRLYPMYLFAAVCGAFAFLALSVPHPIAASRWPYLVGFITSQLIMVPNFGLWKDILLFPVLNPGWSLLFEVLANMGFGALVRLRWAAASSLTAIYLIALISLTYWSHVHHGVSVGWQSSFRYFCGGIARVCLSFFAGVIAVRIFRTIQSRSFTSKLRAGVSLALCAALLFMLLTPMAWMQSNAYQLFALSLGFPCIVLLGSFCRVPKAFWPLCVFLGDFSYPLYLLHYWPCVVLNRPGVQHLVMQSSVLRSLCLPLLLVITALASFVIERLYDVPIRTYLTRRLNPSLQPILTGSST